jgi:hypothetical protein
MANATEGPRVSPAELKEACTIAAATAAVYALGYAIAEALPS